MAIKQYLIPLESRIEWQKALNGMKHTFGHTWEDCYAMHLTTGLKTYLYNFEKDNIRIVCPIAEREYDGYVDIVKPFGFSGFVANGTDPEFSSAWREFARGRGYVCGYLGLNPIFDYSDLFNSDEYFQYNTIYVLDLIPSIDEILGNMARKRRQQLNRFDEKSRLVFDKTALREFFLKNYREFMIRKNASSEYFLSENTLSFLLSLDNIFFIGIQDFGNIVGVFVFAYTADMVEVLFNISLPEGRNWSAELIWYGAKYLKSLGIPGLNLGGRAAGQLGDFKRRFGTKELPLRCLKQIYRPDIYEILCRQVNADPADINGYFPSYRRGKSELPKI